MSHSTAIKTVTVKSLTALRKAIIQLNKEGVECSLLTNATPRLYYPNQSLNAAGDTVAPYVLHLAKCNYDVALVGNTKTGYSPITDFHAGYVGAVLGSQSYRDGKAEARSAEHQLGRFSVAYQSAAIAEVAQRNGHVLQRITKDGKIVLTAQ